MPSETRFDTLLSLFIELRERLRGWPKLPYLLDESLVDETNREAIACNLFAPIRCQSGSATDTPSVRNAGVSLAWGVFVRDPRHGRETGVDTAIVTSVDALVQGGDPEFVPGAADQLCALLGNWIRHLCPPGPGLAANDQDEKPDPDAKRLGNWIIRPGEASYDGKPYFDIDGQVRELLIRLAEGGDRTVSNAALKSALGDEMMSDSGLRTHVSNLNSLLKQHLGAKSNPVTSVKGGRKLKITPNAD